MVQTNAHDVANYILKKTGRIQAIKLQKLCYLAQGWSLAWLRGPLFNDEIRAWRYGPVVYSLYQEHRGLHYLEEWTHGNPDDSHLSADQKKIIDAVIQQNAHKGGLDLVCETRSHEIWKTKFEEAEPSRRGYEVLTVEDIRKEFDRLDDKLMKATS